MTEKEKILIYYLSELQSISHWLLNGCDERDRRLEWLIENVKKRLEEVRNDKTRNVR